MPYLVIMEGPLKGRRFALADGATRIGRISGNHIVLDNGSISSGHAEITRTAEGFRLRDLDSTNGTRVNDHRITDTLLFRNDQIVFGDLPAVFEGDDAPVRQEQAKSPTAPAAIAPAAAAPAPVARPPIVVSSATGKRATVRLPPDFRKRRDLRVFWIAMILLLLVLIGFAGLRFYHTVFAR